MTHVNTDNASDVTLRKCSLGSLAVSQRKLRLLSFSLIDCNWKINTPLHYISTIKSGSQAASGQKTRAAAPRHFTINYIYCITCQVCQYLCRWTSTWGETTSANVKCPRTVTALQQIKWKRTTGSNKCNNFTFHSAPGWIRWVSEDRS